jgi:DNA polymerase delta subunit 3
MLYDFYTTQNAKTPKSVHATYLLTGRKRAVENTNGTNGRYDEDTVMQSSPFMSSMPEPQPQQPVEEPVKETSVVLVREEDLKCTHTSTSVGVGGLIVRVQLPRRSLRRSHLYTYTAWSLARLR